MHVISEGQCTLKYVSLLNASKGIKLSQDTPLLARKYFETYHLVLIGDYTWFACTSAIKKQKGTSLAWDDPTPFTIMICSSN